jgi:hypothetical protein
MESPFSEGLAWYRYLSLQDEFINATRYFPFEKAHGQIWSEFFGDLLVKIGNSVDSFFRNMLKDPLFDLFPNVIDLKKKKRKKDINYFRDFFEPIYQLSGAEVVVVYGLTLYDSNLISPFAMFRENKNPKWWDAYNHVKHTWFDCLKEATLESVVGGLGELFLLNVLHKKSQEYLIRYQQVIISDFPETVTQILKLDLFKQSMIGVPRNWDSYNFIAQTPLFMHFYRSDRD